MEEKYIVKSKDNIFNELSSDVTYAPANNYDIHGNNISGMNLSKKWLPGLESRKKLLYTIDFSESEYFTAVSG